MASAMSARTHVVAAPVVASIPSLRQANSGTSVSFSNGAVAFKRASLMVVRAESGKVEPGPGGRGNTSSAPTTPAGMSGSEAPLGVVTQSAPLEQGSKVPVSERVAYICQDCGYVYDDEKPFEDIDEAYNCPKCSAPKARFMLANASVGEVLDTTEDPQN